MGSLLRVGFEPQDLAYIKPATQCESPQVGYTDYINICVDMHLYLCI